MVPEEEGEEGEREIVVVAIGAVEECDDGNSQEVQMIVGVFFHKRYKA